MIHVIIPQMINVTTTNISKQLSTLRKRQYILIQQLRVILSVNIIKNKHDDKCKDSIYDALHDMREIKDGIKYS